MPLFHYRALSRDGQALSGEMQADDAEAVIAALHTRGYLPLDAVPRGHHGRRGRRLGLSWQLRPSHRPGRTAVATLTRELTTLLAAGLPLDRALGMLLQLRIDPRVDRLLQRVRERVKEGRSLAEALEPEGGAFDRFYINMVRAGEMGGDLAGALARLSDGLQRAEALRDTLRSALLYPAILVGVTVISLFVLLGYVVPRFAALFDDADALLPLATRVVIAIADGLANWWWVLLLSIVALVMMLRQWLQHPPARATWDRLLLRLPLFGGLIIRAEVSRLALTLGTLLRNGVPLLQALSIAGGILHNQALAGAIARVGGELKEGRGLAAPLQDTGLFPALLVQLITVGEETGQMAAMLERIAEVYDRELKTAIGRLLTLLEPLLIVGLGLVIAGIVMSILVAVLAINDLAF